MVATREDRGVGDGDGVSRTGREELKPEPDPGWRIVDVADFCGKGGADLLWRHAESGANRIWMLDRITLTAVHDLRPVDELCWVICPETEAR